MRTGDRVRGFYPSTNRISSAVKPYSTYTRASIALSTSAMRRWRVCCSLARGGRMVIVGAHSGTTLAANPQVMIASEWEILGSRNVSKQELREVVALVASGRIRPIVTGAFPLEAAEPLHEQLRADQVAGRVVLKPS